VSAVPQVVIIGGGFGGLYAARAFKGAPVQVTLVDRHNYHLFQPMLYQVATAALSPGDIASPTRWVLRHQKNVRVLLAEVDRIDPNAQVVVLNEGEPGQSHEPTIKYDYLILATGSTHAYFGHPEWSTRALGLKTLDDALEIRRQVLLSFEAAERETNEAAQRRLLTFVIVGAGPTGVEMAGALAEIAGHALRQDFRSIRPESARILLLEGGPAILSTFPEQLRKKALRSLERLGIDVRTNSVVTMVDAEGVMVGAERIPAQTVLWAAGVAASSLARSLGAPLDRAGRVLVEPTLAVPGHPQIFVIGDLALLQQDGRPLPGVAQVAMQGGTHAAKNILRAIRGEPLLPFRYRDYGSVAVIGRGSAVVDIGPIKASGFFAWVFWLFLHIFWLIGFRNRITVLIEWAWSYITMQRGVRLITGERLSPRS
jgi:NADH dehydrogenase